MTSTSVYSFDVRYMLCMQCGSVLSIPVQGGRLTCGSCGRAHSLGPRDMRPIHQMVPHPVTPEPQRIAALRAQDGRPLKAPTGLESLIVDGNIAKWKLKESFSAWQGSRQELMATGSFDAAERLAFLTTFIPQEADEDMSPLQKRVMYESGMEVMTLPRHRQYVLAQLSRAAARLGDFRSAESWLALCDPAPDDLEMDSSYRVSRALLDTLQGKWNEVIHVLGSNTDDIPIADFLDVFCGVLRANAWEKLGRIDVAMHLLQRELSRGASTVERLVNKFSLCEQSYPQVLAQHESASADKSAAMTGGIGPFLLIFAIPQLLIAFGLLGASFANYLGWVGVFGPAGNFQALVGPMFGGIIMSVISAVILSLGLKAMKAAKRARHIRLHGLLATAQLIRAEFTGTRINHVPQWRLFLNVQLPEKAPYEAVVKMVVPDAAISNMQGKTLKARVAEDNLAEVVLQMG